MALTFQTEVSDGVRTTYPVSFDFLNQAYVYVYVGDHSEYQVQVSYVWSSKTTIELTNMQELPAGTEFFIRRVVPRDDLIHTFADKSIRGALVDSENLHLLYITQELVDGFSSLAEMQNLYNDLNLNLYSIKNLADPVDRLDAVNLKYLQKRLESLTGSPVQDIDYRIWGDKFVGTFGSGFVYTNGTEVARGQDGKYYRYNGGSSYPVSVPANTNPAGSSDYSTTEVTSNDYLKLKVFQTPTQGFTRVKTIVGAAYAQYSVKEQGGQATAKIYSDQNGLNEILQDGINNIASATSQVEFYIDAGEYTLESRGITEDIKVDPKVYNQRGLNTQINRIAVSRKIQKFAETVCVGVPSVTPAILGMVTMDYSTKVIYDAIGTGSASDWRARA